MMRVIGYEESLRRPFQLTTPAQVENLRQAQLQHSLRLGQAQRDLAAAQAELKLSNTRLSLPGHRGSARARDRHAIIMMRRDQCLMTVDRVRAERAAVGM